MPERVARRPVFTLDGRTFSWGDVVALARLDGSWTELEESTRRGVAASKRAAAAGERPSQDDVAEAGNRFRYARNLLAGEELNEWLERWQLTAAQWRGYLERELLSELGPGDVPIDDRELDRAVWAEAACSGFLGRLAERIAGYQALAAAGEVPLEGVTDEAIAHEVSLHRLEWLHVEGLILTVPLEDTAREAALCVRQDGRSLSDVAHDCGTEAVPLSVYAGDLDPELSSALVAAREGELVGPLPHGHGFALVLVERKTSPAADDLATRRRAEERVVRRAVDRALLEHVKWHERF